MLAAVSVMAYVGLREPPLPNKCIFPAGLDCIDHTLKSYEVNLALKNSGLSEITVNDISVDDCIGSKEISLVGGSYMPLPVTISKDTVFRIRVGCSITEKRFKSPVTIKYLNQESGLQQTAVGEVVGNV